MSVLKEKEAALYLGMSRSFLRQGRMDSHRANRTPNPPYIKAGRSIRYLKSDLDAWLQNFRIVQDNNPLSSGG